MSEEQTALLEETIHEIRPENRDCVDEATEEILDEYRANDAITVIEKEDIDMDAFISQSEEFFEGLLHRREPRGLPGDPRDRRLTSTGERGWVRFAPTPFRHLDQWRRCSHPTTQGHPRSAHGRSDAVRNHVGTEPATEIAARGAPPWPRMGLAVHARPCAHSPFSAATPRLRTSATRAGAPTARRSSAACASPARPGRRARRHPAGRRPGWPFRAPSRVREAAADPRQGLRRRTRPAGSR